MEAAKRERKEYISKLFETERGKALLEAIRAQVAKYYKIYTDNSKVEQKIIMKAISSSLGESPEERPLRADINSILKMCKILKEKGIVNGVSGSKLREKATLLVQLKNVIQRKFRDCNSDSDEYDSFGEEFDSDDQNDDDDLKFSINSSDLDSIDSNSDSESFQEMLNVINHQFKIKVNKLVTYFKNKIESADSDESEIDHNGIKEESLDLPDSLIPSLQTKLPQTKSSLYKKYLTPTVNSIKEEVTEGCKRHKKAAQKSKSSSLKTAPSKLSSVLDHFYYNQMRVSESDSSPSRHSHSSS